MTNNKRGTLNAGGLSRLVAMAGLMLALMLAVACGSDSTTQSSTAGNGNNVIDFGPSESTDTKTALDIEGDEVLPDPQTLTTEQLNEIVSRVGTLQATEQNNDVFSFTQNAQTYREFIDLVMYHVDYFWRDVFARSNVPYSSPNYMVLEAGAQPQVSACSGPGNVASPDYGLFYCPADFTIYLGVPHLDKVSMVQAGNYDFAAAFVIAHEFAHHIQTILQFDHYELPGRFLEMSADCLSGVWANQTYYWGHLQDTDLWEAQQAAYSMGDSKAPSERTHGSPDERYTSFTLGYNTGNAMTCLTV